MRVRPPDPPGPRKVRVFVRPSTRPRFGIPRDPEFDLDSRMAETTIESALRAGSTVLVWNEVETLVVARLDPRQIPALCPTDTGLLHDRDSVALPLRRPRISRAGAR